jgi:hypothetical protein
VSEESGAISIALAGALERGFSAERLRDRLRVLLTGQPAVEAAPIRGSVV